jgi:RND family efflux transporter MFP subunit
MHEVDNMRLRKLWLVGAVLLFIATIALLSVLENTADVSEKHNDPYHAPVSVIDARPGTHSGIVRGFGDIQPRWSVDIKAQISGEIVEITPQAMEGESVQEGDLLIRIENSRYKAGLDQAEYNLAKTQLTLQQEEKKAKRALGDWKRSGLRDLPSDMALNKPQRALAQRGVEAAKSAVAAAQQDLSYTQIKAPFAGIVSRRYVSIGQTVNPGDPLVQLLENSSLNINLSLSLWQWEHIDHGWSGKKIPVRNDHGEQIATAHIKNGGGFLDPKTRQYKLFLQITQAGNAGALPGEFAHIDLPGRQVSNTVLIPESALTRDELVWYVDDRNRLRSFSSAVIFYDANKLVVSVPDDLSTLKTLAIVVHPLASFITGREVMPIPAEEF